MSRLRGLLCLRNGVLLAAFLLWNAGCLLGIWLNHGSGQLHESSAFFAAATTCGVASLFFGGVIFSVRMQDWAIADAKRDNYDVRSFWTVAVITGVMAIIMVIGGVDALSVAASP